MLFLANAYNEYCSAPEPIRPVLQKYVRSWFIGAMTLPDSFDDLHPDLLPIVRSRSYFDLNRMNSWEEYGIAPSSPGRTLWRSAWFTTCPRRCVLFLKRIWTNGA